MGPVIVTQELTRHFGDTIAVDGLSLGIESGEVFGFLGPNGAGKTTTIRLLNALLEPTSGSARVLGLDVASKGTEVRRQTGVLTETPSLYESLTARENLLFFGRLYGVAEADLPPRAATMLDEFGLGDRADDRVGEYSKGMRQRLAIARALLHEPPLLFFDEPTAGLDPTAARMVRELIGTLSHHQGRTIFLCTHNLAEAQQLCDRVAVIDQGSLQAIGTPRALAGQLWHGVEIDIDLRGPAPQAVVDALGAMPEVEKYEATEGGLAIGLGGEEAIPAVVAAVAAAGGSIYGVTQREHSLEDIYFRIQGDLHGAKEAVR